MTTALCYVPLHLRSNYSLQCGGSSVQRLLTRGQEYGLEAMALTDVNGLYGAVPFEQSARAEGVRAILGCHLDDARTHAVLLARNETGYETICRLITRRHREGSAFRVLDALHDLHDDVYVLVEDLALADSLREVLPAGRLWLELVRPGRSSVHERELLDAARRLGLGLVASSDIYICDAKDYNTHRLLTAIRTGTVLDQLPADAVAHPGQRLYPGDEMRKLFADAPQSLANTLRIAEDCQLSILRSKPIFPRFNTPAGESAQQMLEQLCDRGLRWRYGPSPGAEARERLRRELDLIHRLGFDEYFLVVREIVRYAREKHFPIAGRGSGASSLVAYVLGLTNVCPLRFNLEFARFLHEQRTDPPDLDLDFCWRTRDEIIEHVFRTFGPQNVAMVSSHLTFQPKSAFRETAKAMGLSNEQITALVGCFPRHVHGLLLNRQTDLTRFKVPIPHERFVRIVAGARRILEFPSHLSVHPGGTVIGRKPIDHYVPVQEAAKGVMITQYDKDGVEAIGLVKFDLLGNRSISTIKETLDWVERIDGKKLDIETLPEKDPATIRLLQQGGTIGCNQLESPAMRHLLLQMKPESRTDIMRVLALIRPGAASVGEKELFIRRRRGLEPVRLAHPMLEPILGENYGIPLYEDDAMLVAAALTGLPLAQADRFRKEIQKASPDSEMIRLSQRFLRECGLNNIARPVAEEAWVQLAKFNSYSFCKAHAASYAVLAYAVAYLKTHHPLAFWAAALNNNEGMYAKRVLVEEAKRAGVRFFLPCVNRSGVEFTVEGGGIRVGLGRIAQVSEPTIETILREKEGGAFESLGDFLGRVRTTVGEVQLLIQIGAFDFTGRRRPELLLECRSTFADRQRQIGGPRLFAAAPAERSWPMLADYSEERKCQLEFELLGFSTGPHLLAQLRPHIVAGGGVEGAGNRVCGVDLRGLGVRTADPTGLRLPGGWIDSRALPHSVGRRVTLLGVTDAMRGVRTEAGQDMEFLTFEDEYGIFEVVLFPDVYARTAPLLGAYGPYRITGVVERTYDALTVTAEHIERLPLVWRKSA